MAQAMSRQSTPAPTHISTIEEIDEEIIYQLQVDDESSIEEWVPSDNSQRKRSISTSSSGVSNKKSIEVIVDSLSSTNLSTDRKDIPSEHPDRPETTPFEPDLKLKRYLSLYKSKSAIW